jgi:rod shape-determining protein MreD
MSYSDERLLLGSARESRISRFRTSVLFAVALGAILFQVYVPLFFQMLGFLDLPLLITVYFALMRRSPIYGLLVGACVGLAQDSLSRNPIGMLGIVKTLVGYFSASVGLRFEVEHPAVRLVLAYFFFLFHQFFYWVLSSALLREQLEFEARRTLFLGILNAFVGLALFHFLDKLRERV